MGNSMSSRIDLIGLRFSRWLVLAAGDRPRPNAQLHWLCRCDCGTEKMVAGSNLRSGMSHGCGCSRGNSNLSHGQSRTGRRTRAYNAWISMKTRTLNPQDNDGARYRDRGIGVSERWLSYTNFFADMGECPEGLSLDRIDNDKGYEKANCRWADRATQNRNTSRNRWVNLRGEAMVLRDATRVLKLSEAAVYGRMRRNNLSLQGAIDRLAEIRLQAPHAN